MLMRNNGFVCGAVAALLTVSAVAQEPDYDEVDLDEMLDFHLNCFAFNSLLAFEDTDLLVARQRAAAHHAQIAQLIIEVSEHPSSLEMLARPKTDQAIRQYQDGVFSLGEVHSYVLERCDEQRRRDEQFIEEFKSDSD